MGGRLNGETIRKMNNIRNYKYNIMEQAKRIEKMEKKPVPGPRITVINMVKEGKSLRDIRKAFPAYDDKTIKSWLEVELPAEEVKKLIKADIMEDAIKKTIDKRIKMYIDNGFEKEKIPYYVSKSKVLLEYTNCKTREELETYIKQIMEEKQHGNEER